MNFFSSSIKKHLNFLSGNHSLSWSIICFFTGLFLTFNLYLHFVEMDRHRITNRLIQGTQILASTANQNPLDPDILNAIEVLADIQHDISSQNQITEQQLESYLWEPINPLTPSIGIRYMPKVQLNSLGSLEMLNLAGQAQPFQIAMNDFQYGGAYKPTKLDEDDVYFPVTFKAGDSYNIDLLGLNFFSDASFHLAMDQARDTGLITTKMTYPRMVEEQPYLLSYIFYPLFSPGDTPSSIEERQARHVGFLSIAIFTLSESFIDFIPESYQGLDVVFSTVLEPFSIDNLQPEFRRLFDLGEFTHASAQADNNGPAINIIARESFSQMKAMQSNNRWWALAIGLILTTWLSSLCFILRNRSLNMQKLVDKRTFDLKESEKRYRMVATNVSDIIHTQDMKGICTYISPSVTKQLGFAVEECLGEPIYKHMTEDSKKLVIAGIERIKQNYDAINEQEVYESKTYCKDGSIKLLESTLSLLPGENGKASGFLVVSRDITERRKNQKERHKLEQTIQQSQKMEAIGTLAGGIAHDFNNLLAGILGHAELIKFDQHINPDIEKSVNVIEKAALRGKELSSQLLGFARKGRFQEKLVNLNNMVKETIQLIDRTLGKDIIISTQFREKNPIIKGDPGQISQILLNLAVNARDAMPEGGNLIFETNIKNFDEIEHYSSLNLSPGKYCVLSVSDTGKGIPEENITRIFEPFFSDKDEGKGTGLGLAMVYGVATNHGGSVSVRSKLGVGTVFDVYLPLSEESMDEKNCELSQASISDGGTVFIVEDESMVRELAENMVARLGYSAVSAVGGIEALQYYEKHYKEIDVIIMDLIMPIMGGIECLEKMHSINPKLLAILATGYTPDTVDKKLKESYILGFLQKPFLMDDLAKQLAQAIKVTH